jgi:hypothetical protein
MVARHMGHDGGVVTRLRFEGQICGIGSTSGHRFVVGRWMSSPFGAFLDVMHERPDGTRRLIAPTEQVAQFVSDTYRFDEVVVAACSSRRNGQLLHVQAGDVDLDITVGRRSPLGWLLRLVPRRLAIAPGWSLVIGPIARVLLPGVRTSGSAGGGRREYYGATDQHRVTVISGTLAGEELGSLASVA